MQHPDSDSSDWSVGADTAGGAVIEPAPMGLTPLARHAHTTVDA